MKYLVYLRGNVGQNVEYFGFLCQESESCVEDINLGDVNVIEVMIVDEIFWN